MDTGQAAYELVIGRGGGLELLPVEITNVTGQADEDSWLYTITRRVPSQPYRPLGSRRASSIAASALRVGSDPVEREQPALPAGNTTAALLNKLEVQLTSEAAMKPARLLGAGLSREQREQVSDGIKAAGIVVFPVGNRMSDSHPIHTGAVGGEYSPAGVELHGKLGEVICSVLGCPSDLIVGSGSSVSARESYRRFSSATVDPLLEVVMQEWKRVIGTPMKYDLSALRASDEVSRARATGSRANAVSKLVQSGVPLDEALDFAGVE